MEILKRGKLERRKFTCWHCGCEFVANPSEYSSTYCNGVALWHDSNCPECGRNTSNNEIWGEYEVAQNEV